MLSLNSLNSVTKNKIKQDDCRVGTQDLLFKRQRLYHSATEPQATEQITILNPILPQWFLRFSEFNASSAPFKENSNITVFFIIYLDELDKF